jgi:hypothetical protein
VNSFTSSRAARGLLGVFLCAGSAALFAACAVTTTPPMTFELLDDGGLGPVNDARGDRDAGAQPKPDAAVEAGPDAQPPPGPGSSCSNPIDITSAVTNGGLYAGRATGSGGEKGGCSPAGTRAKVYLTYYVPRAGNYRIDLATTTSSSDPELASASLFVRTRCSDPSSEIACRTTPTFSGTYIGFLTAGQITIAVEGAPFARDFTIGISPQTSCYYDTSCANYGPQTRCDSQTGACAAPPVCTGSYVDCDRYLSNGCETNTSNNVNHCGGCNNRCFSATGTTATCQSGSCGYTCGAGFSDCNGQTSDGCECGVFTTYSRATAGTCSGSACVLTCEAGYGDCNARPSDGCETDLSTSATSCGQCGIACGASQSCVLGACRGSTTTATYLNYGAAGITADDGTAFYIGRNSYSQTCDGSVASINITSGGSTTVVSGLCEPSAIALDDTYVYVAHKRKVGTVFDPYISRVPRAGGTLVDLALLGASKLAVDGTNVYTLSTSGGAVHSLPKAGGSVALLKSLPNAASAMLVNGSNLYFAFASATGKNVSTLPTAGGNLTTLLSSTEVTDPTALAITGTTLYVADSDKIIQVPLGGGARTSFPVPITATGGPCPLGASLHARSDAVFFGTRRCGRAGYVTPNNGNVTFVHSGSYYEPSGVVADATTVLFAGYSYLYRAPR